MNKKDSLSGSSDILMAGIIAPKMFPRCGVPVLWIPVKTLAIRSFYKNNKSVDKFTKSS
jgi:hypothetical protein